VPLEDPRPMRLVTWRAPTDVTDRLHPLTTETAGAGTVLAGAPGSGGLTLTGGMIAMHGAGGEPLWSKPLDRLHEAVARKFENLLLVAVKPRAQAELVILTITDVQILWGIDVQRLDALLLGGWGGSIIQHERVTLAVNRSRLHHLYRNVLHVTAARHGPRSRMLFRAPGGLRHSHENPIDPSRRGRPTRGVRELLRSAAATRPLHRLPSRRIRDLTNRAGRRCATGAGPGRC